MWAGDFAMAVLPIAESDAICEVTGTRAVVCTAMMLTCRVAAREDRRADARGQLRTAHEMLSPIGAEAFAERAQRELVTTGETMPRHTVGICAELTAQKASIVRLAVGGAPTRKPLRSCSCPRARSNGSCASCQCLLTTGNRR